MKSRKLGKKTPIAILIILFVNLLLPCAEAMNWSPATQLTFVEPAWDTDPSIVQTADGTIWVAWASDREDSKNDIYYKTSINNGVSWTDDTRLTYDAEQDVGPSIIQTADETIWVVWASYRTGNYELFYTTSEDGVSWTLDTQLTSNPTWDGGPSIMQHHNGTIWVVWHRDMGAGNFDLFYKTSPDNGSTWSPEERLTTDTSWDLNPSIIQTYNGTIWVVWASYRTGNYDIFRKTSTNNGASWSPETQLTTDTGDDETPSITQARNGSLWVAWSYRKGIKQSDIYYATSTDYGLTWSPDTQLTTDKEDDNSPTIMNSQEGRIWVAWTSTRINDQFDIFYKTSDIIPFHDVAISSVTPSSTDAYQGQVVNVTVVVRNEGTATETFNVTAKYDNNTIGTEKVTDLAPHTETTLTFNWDTTEVTPCVNYTIKAEASVVPGETDISDNLFIDGRVHVKILGDIDGDGYVGPDDFVKFAGAYGTSPPSNPEADLDRDGDVDPDDFVKFAGKYGKTC